MPFFKNNRYHLGKRFFPSVLILSIIFSVVIQTGIKSSAGAEEKLYVGSAVCAECHEKEYESFTTFSKKAHSFDSIVALKKGLTEDEFESCFECHTTGYGKPGGFVSLEATPDLINVQCEACHGAGSEYIKIMKKHRKTFKKADIAAVGFVVLKEALAEKHCLECHGKDNPSNEKVDPKYKFILKDRLKNVHDHIPLKYEH